MPKKGVVNTPASAVVVPAVSSAKPKRKKNKSSTSTAGSLRFPTKTELLCSIVVPKGATSANGMCPFDMATIPYLKRFSDLFERWSVQALKFEFRTACPSTQGGRIQMGFDWSSTLDKTRATRANIAQLQPTVGGVVWKDFSMQLPQAHLMSRKFYQTTGASDQVDKSPGQVLFSADVQGTHDAEFIVGEIWCTYTVSLMDPRPA